MTAFSRQARPQPLRSAAEVGIGSPTPAAGLRSPRGSSGPSQPRLLPLWTLPVRHIPAAGGMSAPPQRRAGYLELPAAASCPGSAMPARPPAPAPHAPLRRRWGKLTDAESAAAAPLRSPAGAGSADSLPPGDGAEARSSVPAASKEERQETPGHSDAGVFIPSCLRPPEPPCRAAPDPIPLPPTRSRGLSRRRDGAVGAPGEERSACPRSAPRLPGGLQPRVWECPLLRPAPAPALAPLLTAPLTPSSEGKATPPERAQPPLVQTSPEPALQLLSAQAGGRQPGSAAATGEAGFSGGRNDEADRIKYIRSPRARRWNRRVFFIAGRQI